MEEKKLISRSLARRIIFLGVSRRSKGGMTSVILSYGRYIEGMRFICTWNLGGRFRKALYMLQAVVRTTALLYIDRRIRLLHIHGAANASFRRAAIFIRMAGIFGKKVILHEHAADFVAFFNDATDKDAIVAVINKCDRLIVLSESWRSYFISIGVDQHRVCVLNNIVSPVSVEKAVRNPDSALRLLYLGEVSHRKGCYDLLRAIAEHKDEFSGRLHLQIAGNLVDGDISKYIYDHGLGGIVSYIGWVSGAKKDECLRTADVYILPSYNEGLPIAILEAMAYAHPVIATPVGGIPEVIKSGVNGTLVAPGDCEDMASAILRYIDNPADIVSQGRAALQSVQPFMPESVMNSLESIYKELI